MRILITGATGLIGKEIVRLCHKNNIAVNYLTTNKSKIKQLENCQGYYWSPKTQDIDRRCFTNVKAIIHLAGATVSKPWSKSYKKEIINSRVQGTELLIKVLKEESHTVKQVVSASAIGVYPDSLINYYDETFNDFDNSFLSNVVQKWEACVDDFLELNIMVSKIRIGLVLSKKGGALVEMLKPINYGLGSAFGSGKQWQSWIHINDLARMFLFLIKNEVSGVYNGVAPNPVINKELLKHISMVLSKPFFMPKIPRVFMKLVLGEMHTILFESQRASSKKIEDTGFVFKHHHLESALKDLLLQK